MKKVLKWLIAIVVAAAALIVITVYAYLRSTLPDYDGEITVAGLADKVEIIRDSYGMPHIYASGDHDASFALGYAMAQDRLFQMDMVRRTIRGRLAEVVGQTAVKADKLFLTLTAAKPPEKMITRLPPEIQAVVGAFSAGVNHYLHHREEALPIEFALAGYEPEDWTPGDCAAILYYMAWMLNYSFDTEMLHAAMVDQVGPELAGLLFVDYPAGYPTIIPDTTEVSSPENLEILRALNLVRELVGGEGRGASNSWVIAGDKSSTGLPLLANDMHLGHGLPGIWYEAHVVTPMMNVSGVIAPGIPFIVVGANEHVAWGFTNVMTDDADYYRERINPENPAQYEYQGNWEEMTVKKTTIPVKDGPDVPFEIRLTRHGPLINDFLRNDAPPGEGIAMRWVIYDLHQEARALYLLNRAENVAEIEAALEYFKCPGQNLVYADDRGNIGYRAAVGIPRREGFDGALPVPGWTGGHEWQGYVPTGDQPHLTNPSRGWIASANNKPTADDYPYPISHYYAMPDRIERIERMLTEKDKLGIDDFRRMHADLYMVLAEEWVPIFLAALENQTLTPRQAEARDILGEWDFYARPEAVAPSIFHTTVGYLIEHTFRARLGEELYRQYLKNIWRAHNALRTLITRGDTVWFDDPTTPEHEELADLVFLSFTKAVEDLEEKMGREVGHWRWGDLHTLTFYHPIGRASALLGRFLNEGPFPVGGGISTVNPSAYRLPFDWGTYAGASMRYIIDLQDMRNSLRVIPAGISGNFMSPHYTDQVELWRKVEYRPFLLSRDEVEQDAAHRLHLIPQ